MKHNKFLVIVCLLLCIVCLVACTRDLDGTIITTGRKPFAEPDPSNHYDSKVALYDFDGNPPDSFSHSVAILYFTNAESLNNIFHDFVPEDFPGYDIKTIRNTLGGDSNESTSLRGARDQIRLGDAYNGDGYPNLKTYSRAITIVFNFDDLQKMKEAAHSLSQKTGVRGVMPGSKSFQWFSEPNDEKYNTHQESIADLIDLEEAWDHTTGSSVKIGVLDSGIVSSHEDLTGNIDLSLSKAFGQNLTNPFLDEAQHGTSVAGIIGAVGNNNTGTAGVCWETTLVSLKVADYVLNENGQWEILESPDAFIKALEYAENNNIPILNFSGGWDDNNSFVMDAIENYSGLLICAAGNSNTNMDADGATKIYPACYTYSNILTVGASTSSDTKSSYSNYGSTSVDIFAPGENIYTTSSSGSYHSFSGTSAATPVVAGVAGLLLSYHPTLSAYEIKQAILNGADSINDLNDKCVSGGRINAWKALEYIRKNYNYINNGARSSHTCICAICNYTFNEGHSWVSGMLGYHCKYCIAISKFVEVVIPKINKRYQELLERASLLSNDSNFYYVNINEYSALVYDNGKYYFVYECDELGQPIHKLSTEFLADGYTIVGNNIVSTEEMEMPIYKPVELVD